MVQLAFFILGTVGGMIASHLVGGNWYVAVAVGFALGILGQPIAKLLADKPVQSLPQTLERFCPTCGAVIKGQQGCFECWKRQATNEANQKSKPPVAEPIPEPPRFKPDGTPYLHLRPRR